MRKSEEVFITLWQRLAGICITLSSAPSSAGWRRKEKGGGGVREEKRRGKTSILSISEPHLRQFRSLLSKSASFSNLLSQPPF